MFRYVHILRICCRLLGRRRGAAGGGEYESLRDLVRAVMIVAGVLSSYEQCSDVCFDAGMCKAHSEHGA